jgi:uncharacterized protein with PIN domain/sulfur carrier protein ThiS
MAVLRLRAYQELNDFLRPARRGREFEIIVSGNPSVKDVVESTGIPHTEVDVILVNGESVGFDRPVRDGDRVAVYPQFESLDVTPLQRLRPDPLRRPRFVLDGHLGRLAAYLRLFGFDCLYHPGWEDRELAAISVREGRILLTRDRGLLKRKEVTRGYCLRDVHPRRQLVEVLRRFDLLGAARPLTRCMACNGELRRASKAEVAADVPADVVARCDEFTRCPSCGRIFWEGSHFARLIALIESAASEAAA